ncbi:MAG TPA: YfhO family protein [Thermoanaerobaculia bacterium]
MIFLLYAATALTLLWISHRVIQPLSRTAAALLLLLPFCFTGYALLTDQVYGPIDFAYATEPLLPMRAQYGVGPPHNSILSDVACQMIPWRKAVQWSLSHRQWPLFNPFILSGDNLAAAAQPAAYSPFTLIACLLPVAKSLTYSAAIAFFIAGLCAFLFARELGCRESVAVIAAGGWMYSTALSFFILWPIGFTWTFLPIVLLSVRRVVRTPSVQSAALLTVSFTLMLLAGHPETDLHIVFLGCLYALFELVQARANVWRVCVAGVSAGIVALLLCAVYVAPILEAAPQTEEHQSRRFFFATQPKGVPSREVLARLATDVLPLLEFRRWHVEGLDRSPLDTCSAGSIVLAFALYAIWRVRSPLTWFFAALAVFGALEHAEWGPAANALQKLPLFDITLNSRFSFSAAFFLTILAALGIEFMLTAHDELRAAATAALLLIVIGLATVVILRIGLVGENPEKFGQHKDLAEIAGLTAIVTLLLFRVRPHWSAAALLGIVLLQRTLSEGDVYKTLPARIAYPPVPIFEKLGTIREPFRVTGFNLTFLPNMSTLYGLEDVRGYEAMTFNRYIETYPLWCTREPVWFNRVLDLERPFLSFLNVRFAIVWDTFKVPDGWRVFATQPGASLLENTRVIERAFVPRRVTIGMPPADAMTEMSHTTDFRERAWIEDSARPYERENGPGHVVIDPRRLGYELTVDMEKDGWVVISQTAWSGWRAYIDGRRVGTQIANLAFLSVYVPKGHHRVKLVDMPRSFVVGRATSALSLAGIGVFAIVRVARRRRQRAR